MTAPVLSFACESAEPDRFAASPTLLLHVGVRESTGVPVHSGMLRCQIRIDPVLRQYERAEEEALSDLFGDRARWGQTLKPLQLASIAFWLPAFTDETTVTVPVPCTYDTEVATSRYMSALSSGEVPLLLMFSGTVFVAGEDGMQVTQVPWDREARYRLPVATWRATMDVLFPNTGWIRLRRDVLDRLWQYRSLEGRTSWEDTLEGLLAQAGVDDAHQGGAA